MTYTQEELEQSGYRVRPAPTGDWREYDEANPVPGYFQFDWLSSRHPDLYHQFALSSTGLAAELGILVNLAGLDVLDIGAGTGRITQWAAKIARRVTAIDIFEAVVYYGRNEMRRLGVRNVDYVRGDARKLPLADNSVDAVVCAWAVIDHPEAYRVLKPEGYLIDLLPVDGALCGELTETLAGIYPRLVTSVAPAVIYDPDCPPVDRVTEAPHWNGVPVISPTRFHEFTYVADYGDYLEAAAIVGRLYGPAARDYLMERRQSTLGWRLQIVINRVRK